MLTLSTLAQPVAATMASSSAKPRADAGAEHRRPASLACFSDLVTALTLVVPGDEGRRRDHVDACRQDAHEFIDIDPHRVVDDDIRFQREQRLGVVGGRDAHRFDAARSPTSRPALSVDQA
jgi:hypothetical protein